MIIRLRDIFSELTFESFGQGNLFIGLIISNSRNRDQFQIISFVDTTVCRISRFGVCVTRNVYHEPCQSQTENTIAPCVFHLNSIGTYWKPIGIPFSAKRKVYLVQSSHYSVSVVEEHNVKGQCRALNIAQLSSG